MSDWSPTLEVTRVIGLGLAGRSLYFFLMARFGARGLLDVRKPLRVAFLLGTVVITLFGGFRSFLIMYGLQFVVQFYLERLVRTRLCAVLIVAGLAMVSVTIPFASKMPLSFQRCVSFIPGMPVSNVAKIDAEGSTRWRIEMWQILVPEIPKYLILGKGYAVNPSALYLANQATLRGLKQSYEVAMVAGNYHSGPLSVIIPFGIFGAVGFLWLLGAGFWVLYRNYRFGDPVLEMTNTFLLAHFVMQVLMFFFVFGAVETDLIRFTSLIGLSVALNRGVRKAVPPVEPAPAMALQPA
jgi:hypothetical protein